VNDNSKNRKADDELQYSTDADVTRFMTHVNVLDVRHIRSFGNAPVVFRMPVVFGVVHNLRSLAKVFGLWSMVLISHCLLFTVCCLLFTVCCLLFTFSVSRMRVRLLQHHFKLRIVNGNQRPLI
jgi:hypothetical protein